MKNFSCSAVRHLLSRFSLPSRSPARFPARPSLTRALTVAALIGLSLAANAQEFRGVWCSRFQWASTDKTTAQNNINTVMNNMTTGHFNTLFFQVRGQCETCYPSPDEPWSLSVSSSNTDPGWDPLLYAINAAHAKGVKLHAYFNLNTVWSGSTNAPPQSVMPEHIYFQHCNPSDSSHRDWLLYDSSGQPTTYQTGSDEYLWMNPGIPAADAWVRKQAVYLVSNYDVDGLHFDRARMPSIGYGKNPIAVARWDNPQTSTANDGPGNPDHLGWDAFMRDAVTRQLMNICGQCWGVKRLVPMSSSPLGLWEYSSYYQGLGGYSSGFMWGYRYGQDAKAWMQMGAQDFIVPQIYWANGGSKPDFNDVYNDWLSAANSYGRYLVGGANNSVGQTEVESNCLYTRSKGGNGKGFNLWHSANTNFSTWSASGHPYSSATPATPTFPWRSTEGVITGKIFTDSSMSAPVVDAWITRNGSTWTALSSADGFFTFLRVPAGTYTLSFTHPTYGTGTLANVVVTAGQATNVNLNFAGSGATGVIVDNSAAAITGTWQTGTTAADKYGSDYRFKDPGTGTAYLTFTPNLPSAGSYQVYEWHSQGTNRTPSAQHVVKYNGGSQTLTVNQQTNGGKWNLLGTYGFAAGTTGYVRITDSFSGSYVVMADAVRFVATAVPDIIVDNSNSGFTASANWNTGTSAADKYGTDYRFHDTQAVTDLAQWSYTNSSAGNKEIFAWWSQGTNRAQSAPYIVTHASGQTTVYKNQQANGGTWQTLGTYSQSSGSNKVQLSCNTTAGYVVIADALKIVSR